MRQPSPILQTGRLRLRAGRVWSKVTQQISGGTLGSCPPPPPSLRSAESESAEAQLGSGPSRGATPGPPDEWEQPLQRDGGGLVPAVLGARVRGTLGPPRLRGCVPLAGLRPGGAAGTARPADPGAADWCSRGKRQLGPEYHVGPSAHRPVQRPRMAALQGGGARVQQRREAGPGHLCRYERTNPLPPPASSLSYLPVLRPLPRILSPALATGPKPRPPDFHPDPPPTRIQLVPSPEGCTASTPWYRNMPGSQDLLALPLPCPETCSSGSAHPVSCPTH